MSYIKKMQEFFDRILKKHPEKNLEEARNEMKLKILGIETKNLISATKAFAEEREKLLKESIPNTERIQHLNKQINGFVTKLEKQLFKLEDNEKNSKIIKDIKTLIKDNNDNITLNEIYNGGVEEQTNKVNSATPSLSNY